ncbi:MAG: hypothetical protein RL291_808, partial [Pseudomonadota bacterium]
MRKPTLVLAVAAILAAHPATAQSPAPPAVLATSKPIHSLVAQVMEGVGTPRLLIDGNQSPHNYALRPSDARALGEAKVVFRISSDIEPFTEKAFGALPKSTVKASLASAPGVKTLPQRQTATFEKAKHGHSHGHSHGHKHATVDGHVWLDPDNAKAMVDHIASVLSKADVANAQRYAANAVAAKARLDTLDQEIRTT